MLRKILLIVMSSLLVFLLGAYHAAASEAQSLEMASHYGMGDGLHGATTASGEPMNAFGFTAASPDLPMDSELRVCSLFMPWRCVLVRINDRGPAPWTGKSLDLSFAAAMSIGLPGIGPVLVTRL